MKNMLKPAAIHWTVFAVVAVGVTAYLLHVIPRAFVFHEVPSVRLPVKYIALTFDDGPYGEPTTQILDILKEKGVRATFFVVGKNVEKYPDILRREYAEGHTIGNHSYDHKPLDRMSADHFRDNIGKAEAAIANTIGVRPALFRAPYGLVSDTMMQELKREQFAYVGWNDDPDDWDFPNEPASKIVPKVIKGAHTNKVILLHDGRDSRIGYPRGNTVAALPQIIDQLRFRGYEFLTVDQLRKLPAYKQ